MKREFDSLSLPAAQALIREVLGTGNRFRFAAHGTSMCPFIRDGDLVELISVQYPKNGDVLAVAKGERLIVHRVLKVQGDAVLLKGDHVRDSDGWFSKKQILGKVCRVIHRGKPQPIGITRFGRTVASLSRMRILTTALRVYGKYHKKIKRVLDN